MNAEYIPLTSGRVRRRGDAGHHLDGRHGRGRTVAVLAALVVVAALTSCDSRQSSARPELELHVVRRIPHDTSAFTQGLVFSPDGRLFESTGRYGRSGVRRLDPETGAVRDSVALDPRLFGEGLAWSDGHLLLLTWREQELLRWESDPLEFVSRQPYSGEGWGISVLPDGALVTSDGSATLSVRSPTTAGVMRTIDVVRDGRAVAELNELEAVGDVIWANVWRSTEIVRIDAATGHVTATVDLTSLRPDGLDDPGAVLNGIAHRPGEPASRLWVTGKDWPTMFVVDLR